MECVILAAGKSSRFGENKLLIDFSGKNLVLWNIKFAQENKIDNKIIIVINKQDCDFIDDNRITHPIIESVRYHYPIHDFPNIIFEFQKTDEYGPAAGIKAASNYITEDYVVLFGDNFLHGKIDMELYNSDVKVTFRELERSTENLRLGAIVGNNNKFTVKEKPHNYTEGNFYCGFTIFAYHTLEKLKELKPSKRGEYEITEFINMFKNKILMFLDINWIDITYKEDIEKTTQYINKIK